MLCRCVGDEGVGGDVEVSGNLVALGDITEFVRGINFKPDDVVAVGTLGTVACMRTKNVQSSLDLSDVWAVHESFMRREDQCLQEGDILVSSANSWNLVGKCSWIPELPYRATFGGFVSVLRASSSKLDRRYLYRWFSSEYVQETLRSFGQKTTNISNLNISRCKRLQLPLPPLEEQRRIAAILDQAETLRTQRRAALAQLDSLTQSIFLDMFGDPVTNQKGWKLEKLGNLASKMGSGSTPAGGDAAYKAEGISLIRSLNVHDGGFKYKNLAHIDEMQAAKLSNVQVVEDDVLLNITGASVARVCRAPSDVLPARVNQHVMIIRPKASLNCIFLERMLLSEAMKRALLQIGGAGATREAITKAQAEELHVPLPPLPLQQTFATHIQATESLKATHRAALAQLDALFASLQQRAFAGEL